MIIENPNKEDVLGIVQFVCGREEFFKLATELVKKTLNHIHFNDHKAYIVGTYKGIPYGQVWWVKVDSPTFTEFEKLLNAGMVERYTQ